MAARVPVPIRRSRGFVGAVTTFGLVLLAALGSAWVYSGMVTRDQWPIRWLEVDGAFERVSAEQVRAALAPSVAGSFFTVDVEALRAAARRLPWVAEVRIQKRWPDTVHVTIREFEPVAHWTGGSLVSSDGQPFTVPGADGIQGLPWLEGPDGRIDQVIEAWGQFNNLLLPTGLEVGRIRLDRRGAWFLVLSNGTRVHIGRADAAQRLQRLVASWPVLMRGQELAPMGVDLRYTNGFAVQWRGPSEARAGSYGQES